MSTKRGRDRGTDCDHPMTSRLSRTPSAVISLNNAIIGPPLITQRGKVRVYTPAAGYCIARQSSCRPPPGELDTLLANCRLQGRIRGILGVALVGSRQWPSVCLSGWVEWSEGCGLTTNSQPKCAMLMNDIRDLRGRSRVEARLRH